MMFPRVKEAHMMTWLITTLGVYTATRLAGTMCRTRLSKGCIHELESDACMSFWEVIQEGDEEGSRLSERRKPQRSPSNYRLSEKHECQSDRIQSGLAKAT